MRPWNEFIDEHYQAIYRYNVQFLGCKADAEDVTQDTFLKAFKAREKVSALHSERAWLYSIARNCCVDHTRFVSRALRFFALKREEVPSHHVQPESASFLLELLRELSPRQREVFILRHFHDMSTKESAEVLGVDEGTVKVHCKRAVEHLRRRLRDEFPSMQSTDKASEPSKSIQKGEEHESRTTNTL